MSSPLGREVRFHQNSLITLADGQEGAQQGKTSKQSWQVGRVKTNRDMRRSVSVCDFVWKTEEREKGVDTEGQKAALDKWEGSVAVACVVDSHGRSEETR